MSVVWGNNSWQARAIPSRWDISPGHPDMKTIEIEVTLFGKVKVYEVEPMAITLDFGRGGGGATLGANTFTGAQTLPTGTGLLPASSGGTNLGQYNLGFGDIRTRTLQIESGSGNEGWFLDQTKGILLGQSAKLGFASAAASSFSIIDSFFTRGGAAATVQMGENHATTATNQTFKAHNVTNGTAAKLTISGGNAATGTGGAVEIKGGTGTLDSGQVSITGGSLLANVSGDLDLFSGGSSGIQLFASGGAVILNGTNRGTYSTDPTDIAACLVAHGLMAPL